MFIPVFHLWILLSVPSIHWVFFSSLFHLINFKMWVFSAPFQMLSPPTHRLFCHSSTYLQIHIINMNRRSIAACRVGTTRNRLRFQCFAFLFLSTKYFVFQACFERSNCTHHTCLGTCRNGRFAPVTNWSERRTISIMARTWMCLLDFNTKIACRCHFQFYSRMISLQCNGGHTHGSVHKCDRLHTYGRLTAISSIRPTINRIERRGTDTRGTFQASEPKPSWAKRINSHNDR